MIAIKGKTRWAVILCRFSDVANEPQPASFFKDFISETGAGKGGLYDYWRDQSYGAIDLSGSDVFGWYQMQYSRATNPRTVSAWVDEAKRLVKANLPGLDLGTYYGIIAVVNESFGGAATGRGPGNNVAFSITDELNAAFLAHEMGHCYGFGHARDTSPKPCGGSAANPPGDYCDPFCIMGRGSQVYDTPVFRWSGPNLHGPHRDALGWVPANRIWTQDYGSREITLAALDHPNASGYLLAKINEYIVEFRRPTGWDRHFLHDMVLIRDKRNEGPLSVFYIHPARTDEFDWLPGGKFVDGNIVIEIKSFDSSSNTAQVTVGKYSPDVWLRLGIDAQAKGQPAIVTVPGAGPHPRSLMFYWGLDDTLWAHSLVDAPGKSVGGILTSAPAAVASAPSRYDVFARNAAGGLSWIWLDEAVGWGSWTNLEGGPPGGIVGAPVAVASPSTNLQVFARGADQSLWLAESSPLPGGLFLWESLGGDVYSRPAAAATAGVTYVFVVDRERGLSARAAALGAPWSPWQNLGGPGTSLNSIVGDPAVSSSGPGEATVWVRGDDDALWSISRDPATGAWGSWRNQGGILTSSPATHSFSGGSIVWVRNAENRPSMLAGGLWHNLAPDFSDANSPVMWQGEIDGAPIPGGELIVCQAKDWGSLFAIQPK